LIRAARNGLATSNWSPQSEQEVFEVSVLLDASPPLFAVSGFSVEAKGLG
jgi:hypothetical protein